MVIGLVALWTGVVQAATAPNGFGVVWDYPLAEQASATGLDLQVADLDGDGLDDLLLRGMDASNPGLVLVFFGDPVLAAAPDLQLGMNQSGPGAFGDVDGDGDADQLTWTGDPATSRQLQVRLGQPEGPADAAINILIDDTSAPGDFAKKLPLGQRIVDANGDGFGDTLFAAASSIGAESTLLALHLGSDEGVQAGIAWTRVVASDTLLGSSTGIVGDIDNDGYRELVYINTYPLASGGVGASLILTRGGAAGLRDSVWQTSSLEQDGATAESFRVIDGGDLDGDGLEDVLVHINPGIDGESSNLWGYAGDTRNGFIPTTPAVLWSSDYTERDPHVLGLGDFNGDGYDDLVVGDPGRPARWADRSGAIEIFFGDEHGLNTSSSLVIEPNANEFALGAAGVIGGDLTGDGLADVVLAVEIDGVPTLQLLPGFADRDLDGFIDSEDCGPDRPDVHPGAEEIWYNGVDDACDGGDDFDQDGDGVPRDVDCDDTSDAISPYATDVPGNGIDEDCSGGDALTATITEQGGCACRTTGGAAPGWLLVLMLALRRRP